MQNLEISQATKIVLVGASTGGPGQIQKIINSLPQLHNTSIIIAQHMASDFMPSFAKRVQSHTALNVHIVKDGQKLESSSIFICEGNTQIKQKNSRLIFEQEKSSTDSYNPNINYVFNSFCTLTNELEILCVILTGIGDDGIEACQNLKSLGVRCMTESSRSAIVDGMPSRARANIKEIEIDDIENIVKKISEFCK